MNVNSKPGKRIRRTPEAAKTWILKVAADRLAEMGLAGLNISGVARAAGMSHATVIHHFGSTGAMREALLRQMTRELLSDVVQALDHHEAPETILGRLFKTLSRAGHGRLLAWRALEPRAFHPADQAADLFAGIIDRIEAGDRTRARQTVYLVALAAMGLSISGDAVAQLIGVTEEEREDFPRWLTNRLPW